ncbi:hypothetical protein CRG98_022558 [Punica granatum]|uniref:Uncharacterized protein n=1 Tax=Punica granatum TaxID=22663 RepID=A0A2I0JL99_PUNGR|nr:hypothetical protein CRG98_022558 [Punica granatum]
MEGSGSPIGGPNPESTEDSKLEGHQSATPIPPPRSPVVTEDTATSVEGSRSPIGDPNFKSTGDLQLGVLNRFGVGAANRRPRLLDRGRWQPP